MTALALIVGFALICIACIFANELRKLSLRKRTEALLDEAAGGRSARWRQFPVCFP